MLLTDKNNKKFVCVVKVWHDKINGNTYHNIKLFMNNEILVSGVTYGYDTQYEETAYHCFNANESWKDKPFRYPNKYVFRNTINFEVIEVKTKKELKKWNDDEDHKKNIIYKSARREELTSCN
mgnify:FL=1|tara:strand:+ start:2569 stop:2937 length:369 start_codon:yes stop_codon:yes gene_type:complete